MNGLEFAMKMEMDAEAFYREQALENKDNRLNPVFLSFAEDEKMHANIIKEKLAGRMPLLEDHELEHVENIFTDASGIASEKSTERQINAYRKALEMEEKSIDVYKQLMSESKSNKDIFKFLVKQEEKHYKLTEEIIRMVNRPIDWVESAEFGVREEY